MMVVTLTDFAGAAPDRLEGSALRVSAARGRSAHRPMHDVTFGATPRTCTRAG